MIPFKTLHVGLSRVEHEYLPRLGAGIKAYEQTVGIEVILVPIGDDIAESLSSVGRDVEAFALARMPTLSPGERAALIDSLTARKIPTFSLKGYPDVEMGALAAINPDIRKQRTRRVALNLSRLIRGEPAGELPILLSVDTRLVINGRTAAAVGYMPSLATRNYAEFIYEDELTDAPKLSFKEALDIAEENNVSLLIKDADVESSLNQKQRARSPLLPQILTNAAYENNRLPIDSPTPLFPEEATTLGVSVSQMIYDDQAVTDFRSSGYLYEGNLLDREAERLDVLAQAGDAYLLFALAGVLYRVSADNVRLTQDNLELSRVRFDAGYSGRDEVLRWESALASRRSDLLRRAADTETQRISLNQILGVSQDRTWVPEQYAIDTEAQNFWLGRVGPVFDNATLAERFVEFLVEFAIENSPEMQAIDQVVTAQDIQIAQRKRTFILPSFVANFSYNYFVNRSPDPAGARDDLYRVEIAAIYPLFEGGNKYYDVQLQQSELQAIKGQKEFTRQVVEQRTRTALNQVASSFPIIVLSQVAADAAQQNLIIVQDKYGQGILNVTDLLSAQNDFFVADQNEAGSVYTFLLDLVALQRAISWFEDEKTPDERDAFYTRAREAVGLE
jgi:outer membrane protein TolC